MGILILGLRCTSESFIVTLSIMLISLCLHRSESASQVFVILVQWMLSLFKDIESDLPTITLAYDNMCNLDKIKASKAVLPFEPPYDKMWMNVKKIIDKFHFKNHVSPVCKELYCPDEVKEKNPKWNTQAGEQTFTWLSRFKHMSKNHHLFYIHRMVIRRNAYTSKCNVHGKIPILPKSVSKNY